MRSILTVLLALSLAAVEQAELPYDLLADLVDHLPADSQLVMRPGDPADHDPLAITLVHGDGREEPVALGADSRLPMPLAGAERGGGCRVRANRPKGTMTITATAVFTAGVDLDVVEGRIGPDQLRPIQARMDTAAAAAARFGAEAPTMWFQLTAINHLEYQATVTIGDRVAVLAVGDGRLRFPLAPADLAKPVTIQCDKPDIRFAPR